MSDPELVRLIESWLLAQPIGGLRLPLQRVAVPAHLLDTVTRVEPYRTETLEDAGYFLAWPKLVGIGLEIDVLDAPCGSFEGWTRSIRPVTVRMRWSRTMDAGFTDECVTAIERVAHEDGAWRMVRLWSARARAEARALFFP